MRPTTQRLFSVAVLIFTVSVVGLILAIIFQWPTQFDGSGNPNATAGEAVTGGTVTSLPLFPWIALAVFALLTRSRRWWGSLAVLVLCFLGALFVLGGLGEGFAPSTPYVPRVMLVAAGVVYVLLGLSLLLSGIADLIDRARAVRRPSRVS
jgi:peptidoglycan/LPS O-acetylase OafA/YrhL